MTAAEDLAFGLRQLADFLSAHPEMPVTSFPQIDMPLGVEQVTVAAGLLADPLVNKRGHLITGQMFGVLQLRAYHVPDGEMARWHAVQAAGEAAVDGATPTLEGARS